MYISSARGQQEESSRPTDESSFAGAEVTLGAIPLANGHWQFLLWAPKCETIELHLLRPHEQIIPMRLEDRGYHRVVVDRIASGTQYVFHVPTGRELPDPASRFQPQGVHGPSEVVSRNTSPWSHGTWKGRFLEDYVIYELHIGAYTPEGTFESVIPHLEELVDLGITAIELMPVTQFPGSRNWGYDGAYPFAAQNSYGGPSGLLKLVDAAHRYGLAVVLDVVYNHLGPEGNHLDEYGPYYTDRYGTPWGLALNFDGAESDEVRRFFVESALYWLDELRIDALRVDAIHSIVDTSAIPFLADLSCAAESLARRTGRRIHLIAESDLNDVRVLRARPKGGFGHDAQWSDDFHHAVQSLLTGERSGYYADFGKMRCLATTLNEGWYFSGQYSSYRRRRHGNSSRGVPKHRFVVCSQNHDQVGNRALGDRLSRLVDFEALKLAAGITLLSPFIPLLFMGEEYGETAPFQYFTSHSDASLIEAVRRGRREEFAAFAWIEEVPDPQALSTFENSKLDQRLKLEEPYRTLHSFYRELLACRRHNLTIRGMKVKAIGFEADKSLAVQYSNNLARTLMCFNFSTAETTLRVACAVGAWQKRLDSADPAWRGPGSTLPQILQSPGRVEVRLPSRSFAVFRQEVL